MRDWWKASYSSRKEDGTFGPWTETGWYSSYRELRDAIIESKPLSAVQLKGTLRRVREKQNE